MLYRTLNFSQTSSAHICSSFAVFAGSAVFGVCLLMLAPMAPVQMPPLAAAWVVVGVAVMVGLAVGEFHRRTAA